MQNGNGGPTGSYLKAGMGKKTFEVINRIQDVSQSGEFELPTSNGQLCILNCLMIVRTASGRIKSDLLGPGHVMPGIEKNAMSTETSFLS
jgi:hypothetical protein